MPSITDGVTPWENFVFMYLPQSATAVPAGQLVLLEQGTESIASRFGYGKRYLTRADAVPVDPRSLPLDARPGNEQLYAPINQLTQFGAIRDAAPDFWGRRVIEAKLRIPPDSVPESVYLQHGGPHRFGALDFRATTDAGPTQGALPDAIDLTYLLDAADRVQDGLPIPRELEPLLDVGTMGGARPKAVVVHAGRQYLAKFPAKYDPFNIPLVEFATLDLARQCGLDVPATDLRTLADGRQVMLIERFDRAALDGRDFARRHCVSALTLLGKAEQESASSGYDEISNAIAEFGAKGFVTHDRRELFARMVFNILVSNQDDHLRNHAFVRDGNTKGWRLSPLYDVVPTPQVATERRLHLSVGPQGRLATLTNALEAHGAFGLLRPTAKEIIERVAMKVRAWKVHFERTGVPAKEIAKVGSAFRKPRDIGWN